MLNVNPPSAYDEYTQTVIKFTNQAIDQCLLFNEYKQLKRIHQKMKDSGLQDAVASVTFTADHFQNNGIILARAIGRQNENAVRYYLDNMRFMIESSMITQSYTIKAFCDGITNLCQLQSNCGEFIEYLLSVICSDDYLSCGPEIVRRHYKSKNVLTMLFTIAQFEDISYARFERIFNMLKDGELIDSYFTLTNILDYGINHNYVTSNVGFSKNLQHLVHVDNKYDIENICSVDPKRLKEQLQDQTLCQKIRENMDALAIWITALTVSDNEDLITDLLFKDEMVDKELITGDIYDKLDYIHNSHALGLFVLNKLIVYITCFPNTKDLVRWVRKRLFDESNNSMEVFEIICTSAYDVVIYQRMIYDLNPLMSLIMDIKPVILDYVEEVETYNDLGCLISALQLTEFYPMFKILCDKTNVGKSVFNNMLKQTAILPVVLNNIREAFESDDDSDGEIQIV